MADKTVNGLPLGVPSFGDHLLFQEGVLPTNTTGRLTPESLNRLFLGENIIPVYQESDIGIAVSGEVFLEDNKSYLIMASIVTANTWVFGNTNHILDPGYTNNNLTFVGPVAFRQTALELVRISNIRINGGGATQLFDFTSTVGGSLSMDRCLIAGFASLGHVTGCSTAWQRITCLSFGAGITFDGGTLLAGDFLALQSSTAVTNCITIKGAWTGPVSFSLTNLAADLASGFGIFIDPGFTGPVARFRDIGFPNGTMFNPAGFNGTAINIQASGLDGVKDSQVVGIMSMDNNGTTTEIFTQNVYESIEGVTIGGVENERITHSGNILTYIGLETTSASILGTFSGTAISGNYIYEYGVFKNNVLVPNAHMSNDLSSRVSSTALPFIVTLETGDTLEVKVRNTESSVNILVVDLVFTLTAAI